MTELSSKWICRHGLTAWDFGLNAGERQASQPYHSL